MIATAWHYGTKVVLVDLLVFNGAVEYKSSDGDWIKATDLNNITWSVR